MTELTIVILAHARIQKINFRFVKTYYVYVLSSGKSGTLYIGMTSNLVKRVFEHKNKSVKSFTEKYDVHDLVYFESTTDVQSAIAREKQLKHWKRSWKVGLIEKENPSWSDLYLDLVSGSRADTDGFSHAQE